MKTHHLLAALVATATLRVFGASWDSAWHNGFVTAVQNNFASGESVSCVATVGNEVYVGTTFYSGTIGAGRLFRFKETTGVWEQLGTFSGSTDPNSATGIYAMSGAQQPGDSTRLLFIGGNFTSVTYGTSSSAANNVVAFNITGSSQSISKLGTSTVYGVDGVVYALKALPWSDLYFGQLYPGMRCVVGGIYSNAGSISSKSIAMWQQGSVVNPTWIGFSGGLSNDGGSGLPKVYGVDALTGSLKDGDTTLSGIWMTGAFVRGSSRHVAKLTGTTWTDIGQGFLRSTLGQNCAWSVDPYPSFFGEAVARVGANVYFGGFSTGHKSASGTLLISAYDNSCGCPTCVSEYSGMAKITTTSTALTGLFTTDYVRTLAAKGSDLYASGILWFDVINDAWVSYAKMSSAGVWTALTTSGIPPALADSAASSSAYVYFAADGSVYRYSP